MNEEEQHGDGGERSESKLSRRELAQRMVAATGGAAIAAAFLGNRSAQAVDLAHRKILIERIANTRYKLDTNASGDQYVNVWERDGVDWNDVHATATAHLNWLFVDNQTGPPYRDSFKNLRGKRNGAIRRDISNTRDTHAGYDFTDDYELDKLAEAYRALDTYWQIVFNDQSQPADYLNDVYHVMRAKILFEMDHARVDGICRLLRYVELQPSFPVDYNELKRVAEAFVACAVNYYQDPDYLNGEYDFDDYVQRYDGQDPCLRGNAGFPQGESWY